MQKLIKNLLESRWLLSTLSIAVTLFLLLLPGSETKKVQVNIVNIDKIAHIILFGGCALSLYFDMRLKEQSKLKQLTTSTIIILLGAIIGYVVEIVQAKYLGRTFSIDDVVADTVGLIVGIAAAHFSYSYVLSKWSVN